MAATKAFWTMQRHEMVKFARRVRRKCTRAPRTPCFHRPPSTGCRTKRSPKLSSPTPSRTLPSEISPSSPCSAWVTFSARPSGAYTTITASPTLLSPTSNFSSPLWVTPSWRRNENETASVRSDDASELHLFICTVTIDKIAAQRVVLFARRPLRASSSSRVVLCSTAPPSTTPLARACPASSRLVSTVFDSSKSIRTRPRARHAGRRHLLRSPRLVVRILRTRGRDVFLRRRRRPRARRVDVRRTHR